ncbi:histone transcription regulator HIRA, WD repeat superfamily [Aureobasidium pullulans]|uniref:Protein HIR n=1 Tax=Aureobasidium pullulans TaxID=5580 RepID=A0A4S9X8M6_AURPU|nr:histone transcription regulator HIRA, WD repeat superfamily [Aureobasidium pullulans]
MRFTKPIWLTHGGDKKDFEVYSCHVSPDGSRLVTAGGEHPTDGHVRIWSTDAIRNGANAEYNKPKQLAAMSYHSGTIHSVRFSGNGKYLASGADDKIVCIYNLDPNPPTHTTFGSNETPPVENWRIFRRLIGHDNDVQDLGWSADSSILVSVGLDSKVVVWSGHTFEKLKTLSQHQSHVKGITFDPANKYFATASDDRTIRIFRFTSPPPNATTYDQVNNFVLEATVSVPFTTSPLTTYFRRCSWSPDGAHIAAANAVNGPVSSVAIVTRGSWESEVNLIGHEGPVEVCAFSPRLFCPTPPPPASDTVAQENFAAGAVTVVACAGQDKTLSVWNTNSPRPFVVTQELAAKPISDLAWSPDGETVYFTSLDGTIACCVFAAGELGYPAPVNNNDKALARFGAGRRVGVVEGPDALRLEENSKAGELKGVQGRMGELMGDGTVAVPSLNGSSEKSAAPSTNGASEKATTNGSTETAEPKEPMPPPDPQVAKIDKLKQRVTITKDGKKRIAPLLVSSSAGVGESSLPKPQLMSSVSQASRNDAPQTTLDLSKPFDGLPRGGLASLLLGNKRKFAEIEGDDDHRTEKRIASVQQSGATPVVINTAAGLVPPSSVGKSTTETAEPLRPAIVNPSLSTSQVRLAVPLVRTTIVRPLDTNSAQEADGQQMDTGDESSVVFEARNASGPARTGRVQDRDPTRLTVSRRGQSIWQDYLPRAVLLVTGNHNFWAAACEDGSVYVWTPAGRRLVNALILDAQPVIMDCRGWWLLCVNAVGMCYVWNIKTLSSPHPPVSLAPVLDIAATAQQGHTTNGPAVMFARLNSQGRIVVGLSNGDGYSYSQAMYIWQRLSEPWWAVGSQYWNTADTSISTVQPTSKGTNGTSTADDDLKPENLSAGIIPLLERNTTTQSLLRGRAYFLQRLVKTLLVAEGYEGFESAVSVAHLENRVAAAMTLGAREEFHLYLLMYAKRIGAEGSKAKVEELLRSLMGSVFEDEDEKPDEEKGQGWMAEEGDLVGWPREELLKEVVLILGKHRDLQRITVPYARLLGVLDGASDTAASSAMEI